MRINTANGAVKLCVILLLWRIHELRRTILFVVQHNSNNILAKCSAIYAFVPTSTHTHEANHKTHSVSLLCAPQLTQIRQNENQFE